MTATTQPAGDWIGWVVLGFMVCAIALVMAARVYAHRDDIAHWLRVRRYVLRHAVPLIATSRAYDEQRDVIRRLVAEREALHREIDHLTAQNNTMRRALEEGDHNRISIFTVESLRG